MTGGGGVPTIAIAVCKKLWIVFCCGIKSISYVLLKIID